MCSANVRDWSEWWSHVHNSRAVCTNIVVMEMHFARVLDTKCLVPRASEATKALMKRETL